MWVAVLQTGVVPLQSAFPVQRTQVAVVVSHTGVAPVQASESSAEHCPQAPVGWQAGVAPPHSLSLPQLRQVRKTGSQTGVEPAQSLPVRHPTQVCVATLHWGVVPPQVVLSTQATQVAVAALQAGFAPPQWVVLPAEHSPQAPLA